MLLIILEFREMLAALCKSGLNFIQMVRLFAKIFCADLMLQK